MLNDCSKLTEKSYYLYKYFLLILIFLIIKEKNQFIKYKHKYPILKSDYYECNNNFSSYIKYDDEIFFTISPLKYFFSYKYNIIEVEFNIKFYDKNKKLIIPSYLAFHYELHVICSTKYRYSLNIDTLSDIYNDQYFKCSDYYQLNEKIELGIKIDKSDDKLFNYYIYSNKAVNYQNNSYINDYKFNPLKISYDFFNLNKNIINIQNKTNNYYISLKKLFISNPYFIVKNKMNLTKNFWHFKNIYNNYFCFCIGSKCKGNICKYKFYLYIIDKNRLIYNKTDYLLADFLQGNIASGDAYFLFQEMIKQEMPAHYVTEKYDIYKNYIVDEKEYPAVILIKRKQYDINGDTLEKYLDLFLRLKVVVSGAKFISKYNIFYNIEYITFICIGHGVNFFKPFLYDSYYGINRYNKIILPSNIIAKIAKQYGWTDDNIILIGLPKWDIFDNYSVKMSTFNGNHKKETNKIIFIMFTWRELIKEKISEYYLLYLI